MAHFTRLEIEKVWRWNGERRSLVPDPRGLRNLMEHWVGGVQHAVDYMYLFSEKPARLEASLYRDLSV